MLKNKYYTFKFYANIKILDWKLTFKMEKFFTFGGVKQPWCDRNLLNPKTKIIHSNKYGAMVPSWDGKVRYEKQWIL